MAGTKPTQTPHTSDAAERVRRVYREALYNNIAAQAAAGPAKVPTRYSDLRAEPIRSPSED